MTNKEFLNVPNLKIWSKIGMRAAFGLISIEILKTDKNFFVVTGDVLQRKNFYLF